MKHFSFILFIVSFSCSPLYAQREAVIQYDDGTPTQYNVLNAGDEAIAMFQPAAPCRIESITFGVSAAQSGGQIVFHLWKNEGGNAFPELYWDWSVPDTVSVPQTSGVQYITMSLLAPIDDPTGDLFYAGATIVDPGVHLMEDAGLSPPSCSSGSGGVYYHSFLYTNNAYYIANGDLIVRANVSYYDEQPAHLFSDVTQPAGFQQGFAGSKRMCWGDYDRDGYEDVLVGGSRLYKNNGNGTFTDVTAQAGIDQGGAIAVFADMDNDGWLDLVVEPGGIIYRNNHDGTFTKHAGVAPKSAAEPTALAIADYDRDGRLDYYVGSWENEYQLKKSDYPNSSDPNATETVLGVGYPAYLFHNDGNLSFSDSTSSLEGYGLENLGYNPYTNAYDQPGYRVVYGAQWCDYDNDGDLDLFVCNYRLQGNFLWRNGGKGRFTDAGAATGLIGHDKPSYPNTYGHTIGCDWGDYNNDGNMDVMLSQLAHPRFLAFSDETALYRNSGPPAYTFTDMRWPYDSDTTGINYEETHTDVGWGDYDNDGLLDFGITAVYGCRYASLYHQNSHGGSFTETTRDAGIKIADGWGVTWVDYDNDGKLDLVMSGDDGFHLFHNDVANDFHSLAIHPQGTDCNREGVGARFIVFAGGRRMTRDICAGKGSGSSNPPVAYFGLGAAVRADSLVIRWPCGHRDKYYGVPADTALLAIEDSSSLKDYRASLPEIVPSIKSVPPATNIDASRYPGDTNVYTRLPYRYKLIVLGSSPITYDLFAAPAGMTLDSAGNLQWMPAAGDTGGKEIALRAANRAGADTQRFQLRVVESQSPHFFPHGDRTAVRNQLYMDTVFAEGIPAPRFSMISPTSPALDSLTGIITWNPGIPVTFTFSVQAWNPLGADTLAYKVQVMKSSGVFEDERQEENMTLFQNYPNPFVMNDEGNANSTGTAISYFAPRGASGELAIYNALGVKVKTLAAGGLAQGVHTFFWRGTNDDGEFLPSGDYMYLLRIGSATARKTLVLIR